LQEIDGRIRAIESKAISFAAYGAAIVTLLVSSLATWSGLGNHCSVWIAVCAGICGLACTFFSVRVLLLRKFPWHSEDDWLKTECFSSIFKLKRYRILTTWAIIHSHNEHHEVKATYMGHAQVWLTGSVIFLIYLLVQVALLVNFPHVLRVWIGESFLGSSGIWGGAGCALILGMTFILLFWRSTKSV
jgi:hypothetical protein